MNIIEEHHSPDRVLRLIVIREKDGDTSIGFDGYSWHTHGDILSELSGLPEEEAIRKFVDAILCNVQVIAVSRIQGKIQHVWPTDNAINDSKYKPAEESLEFRYWSGTPVEVS